MLKSLRIDQINKYWKIIHIFARAVMYVYTVYPSNTTVDTYKLIRCEKKSHEQQVLTDLISGSQFKKKKNPMK